MAITIVIFCICAGMFPGVDPGDKWTLAFGASENSIGYLRSPISVEIRDWSHILGGERWWRQGAVGRLTWLNYFKNSEETVSAMTYAGFCQRGRTYRVRNPAVSHWKFFQISCVAIAVENLPPSEKLRRVDLASVSRKRFKPSTPGSSCYDSDCLLKLRSCHK